MKFYQYKRSGRVFNIFLLIYLLFFIGCAIWSAVDNAYGAAIVFFVFSIPGILALFFLTSEKAFKGLIDINSEKVMLYYNEEKYVSRWEEIEDIHLQPVFFPASKRIMVLTSDNTEGVKRIFFEYNDEILAEVKKYWEYRIGNEDKYIQYKRRLNINSKK